MFIDVIRQYADEVDKKERVDRYKANNPGKPFPRSEEYYAITDRRKMEQTKTAAEKNAKRQERLAAKRAAIAAARKMAIENGINLNAEADEV